MSGSEIPYEERRQLAYAYVLFFMILGLFLFMAVIYFPYRDWSGAMVVLFFAILLAIVIYKVREWVLLYPHYKEVAVLYASWVGIPMAAVGILVAIVYYYGERAMAYILSILFLFIPIIAYRIVRKRYPMFVDKYNSEKENVSSEIDQERYSDLKKREESIAEIRAGRMAGMVAVMFLFLIVLYSWGWSPFSILITELILIFISYKLKIFDLHSISQTYRMMGRARKKHLSVFSILWLSSVVVLIFFIITKNTYLDVLFWCLLILAFLYNIFLIKKE